MNMVMMIPMQWLWLRLCLQWWIYNDESMTVTVATTIRHNYRVENASTTMIIGDYTCYYDIEQSCSIWFWLCSDTLTMVNSDSQLWSWVWLVLIDSDCDYGYYYGSVPCMWLWIKYDVMLQVVTRTLTRIHDGPNDLPSTRNCISSTQLLSQHNKL